MMTSERVEEIRASSADGSANWDDPIGDARFLIGEVDRLSANTAGLRTDVAAAKNRADRLQAELDRVTRERDREVAKAQGIINSIHDDLRAVTRERDEARTALNRVQIYAESMMVLRTEIVREFGRQVVEFCRPSARRTET